MNWRMRKSSGAAVCRDMRERLIPGSGSSSPASSCVPRGCVAVLVVGRGGEEEEDLPERVVVDVRALGRPRVRALLEAAEREFGYDQKGVLRVPCDADEFRRAVAADDDDCAAHPRRCRGR